MVKTENSLCDVRKYLAFTLQGTHTHVERMHGAKHSTRFMFEIIYRKNTEIK